MTSTTDTRQFLQNGLEKVKELMLLQVKDYHPDLKAATEIILSCGGKKIRPRIILLTGRLLGAEYEPLVTLAASIEMLHTATLVHDDLIDGSILRRGMPTLNSRWSPAATVLTGDFVFSSAAQLAARTGSLEVMDLFSQTLMTIVNGEVNQLFTNRCSLDITDYYHRIYAKTASLFETSAHSAAILGKADDHQIERLRKFGYELGMAFQIVDDILDYTGDPSKIGKPVGSDARQGLITLPLLHYINDHPDLPTIKTILDGNRILDEMEIQHLVQCVAKSESLIKAQNEADLFSNRAIECLFEFPDRPERSALIEIARNTSDRKK